MSSFKRFLAVFAILVLTNVGTYFFAHWQCQEKLEGKQQLIDQAAERNRETRAELEAAEQELSRLRVWGDFIEIQQDLNRINDQINQLNFGNALEGIDEVMSDLEAGDYGTTFRKHRSRLEPLLLEAKQALRNRSDRAREDLVEFNREAFGILSGLEPVEERSTSGDSPSRSETEPEAGEDPTGPEVPDTEGESPTGPDDTTTESDSGGRP
ncbi:MAG: hypothetical protein R3234_05865 [Thermoanaerobaculia bacterium]|nr:hypothetical protein [Thermoanaerobaculia bacterium]